MKRSSQFQVITPDPVTHRTELLDMTSKVFSRGMGYFGAHTWSKNAYIYNSNYDWNSSCIGIMDGRIVTHFGIWGYDMRIGRARVKTAGVGLVATHADYRKRGLMGKTIRRCLELVLENNYDVSLLFGIAHYYDRFGYVSAWVPSDYRVEGHLIGAGKPTHRIYKFAPRHRGDLATLYNRENATRTGTAVRPTYLKNQWPEKWSGYLWKDGRGKVIGYVIVARQDGDLQCVECVGDDAEVLAVLATLRKRWALRDLRFKNLHYDSPLRKRITRRMCWERRRYIYTGGPMIRLVNLKSMLTKMTGELAHRLKQSHLAGWKGTLLLADARDKVALNIHRSRVTIAEPSRSKHAIRGGERLAQLLIGGEQPEEIIEAGKMRLTGDAPRLVDVLFPNQHPSLDTWDHY